MVEKKAYLYLKKNISTTEDIIKQLLSEIVFVE